MTVQDPRKLYMAMEPCPLGDLYQQLEVRKTLPLEHARVYAAEMVLMLEYLRRERVVFRFAASHAGARS